MEKQRWEESEKRREEKKKEDQRRERVRRKKMQVREKVEKSRNTVLFQWFVGPEGRKVGSLKQQEVRSQLADERWTIASCCGAKHISKSKCTKHTTFRALLEVEIKKVHAVVARRTFESQHVQNTPSSEHFWKLRCSKSIKKCTSLWREAHFEVKRVQNTSASEHFWKLRCWKSGLRCGAKHSFRVAGARDCALCQKWAKREGFHGFCNISKNDGRHGTFEEDLQIWISRGRCSTRDMFIRDVRRSGRWFPETGCILKHQIFRFAKMILRDRSSTLYGLASLFRGRRAALDRWSGKMEKSQIALVRGRLCIQLSILEGSLAEFFRFWRLSSSKIEEVSQKCWVFDVAKFKNWGGLAELLRFWCCQLEKLRKSRRIASFSSLQIDR